MQLSSPALLTARILLFSLKEWGKPGKTHERYWTSSGGNASVRILWKKDTCAPKPVSPLPRDGAAGSLVAIFHVKRAAADSPRPALYAPCRCHLLFRRWVRQALYGSSGCATCDRQLPRSPSFPRRPGANSLRPISSLKDLSGLSSDRLRDATQQ